MPIDANSITDAKTRPTVTYDDIITGERLQALADVTVITDPILRFHKSLSPSIALAKLPGTMTTIELDQLGRLGPFPVRTKTATAQRIDDALAPVKRARSIFVYTHLLPAFIAGVLPHLTQKFVLITHNSDGLITDNYQPLLADARLLRWFAQSALISHPKLECLPIGVANAQWRHGNLTSVMAAIKARSTPTGLVYANFKPSTHPDRQPLLDLIQSRPFMTLEAGVSFETYLAHVAAHRFCLSPPGNGIDAHRTWESLYLGSIPIVTTSFAATFPALPMLGVDSWADITPELLDEAEVQLQPRFAKLDQITMSYWRDRITAATAGVAQ
jgi:hypothetical protein